MLHRAPLHPSRLYLWELRTISTSEGCGAGRLLCNVSASSKSRILLSSGHLVHLLAGIPTNFTPYAREQVPPHLRDIIVATVGRVDQSRKAPGSL